jgi:predicted ester cyclase
MTANRAYREIPAGYDHDPVMARMTGTQRGEFMGIPPAGNTINVSVCDYFRVDNGALTEHWGIMDAAGMMRQLTAH